MTVSECVSDSSSASPHSPKFDRDVASLMQQVENLEIKGEAHDDILSDLNARIATLVWR